MTYFLKRTVLSLLLFFQIASGLICYICKSFTAETEEGATFFLETGVPVNQSCVDAVANQMTSENCSTLESGKVAKCALHAGSLEYGDYPAWITNRKCVTVENNTHDTCTGTTDPARLGISNLAIKISAVEVCYCSTDNCNGQTALFPTIVPCWTGFALAVLAIQR